VRDLDLLVVGELNADIVVTDPDPVPAFGQAERVVRDVRLTLGSSSAITACGAARLGLRVAMVGVVGDDALGRFVLDALTARGVDTTGCRVATGRPTGASVILGNGTDRAILTALGTIADTRATDVPDALLDRARHLHVGSLFLQPALAADLPALFGAARAGGATTSLDPNWDPSGGWDGGFAAALAESDVVLPNDGEAVRLTGAPDAERAARTLAGDTRIAVVKLGPAGALAAERGNPIVRVAARSVDAVDTTGAGDSFDAGFIAARLDGRPVEDALEYAVACGSLSTRVPGGTDGQATRDEVEAWLETDVHAR
jgi:sugar/nucleoside kinase (ribokinase family)